MLLLKPFEFLWEIYKILFLFAGNLRQKISEFQSGSLTFHAIFLHPFVPSHVTALVTCAELMVNDFLFYFPIFPPWSRQSNKKLIKHSIFQHDWSSLWTKSKRNSLNDCWLIAEIRQKYSKIIDSDIFKAFVLLYDFRHDEITQIQWLKINVWLKSQNVHQIFVSCCFMKLFAKPFHCNLVHSWQK